MRILTRAQAELEERHLAEEAELLRQQREQQQQEEEVEHLENLFHIPPYQTTDEQGRREEREPEDDQGDQTPSISSYHSTMADPRPNIPLPKVPTFDGTTDIEAFAYRFKAFHELTQRTEDESIRMLPFSLKGKAGDLYFRVWGTTAPTTIDQALEPLISNYGSSIKADGDYTSLMTMKQRTNESVEEYTQRFSEERTHIRGTIPDMVIKTSYTRGLLPRFVEPVINSNPTSFLHAVAAAKRAEQATEAAGERRRDLKPDGPSDYRRPQSSTITTPQGYQGRNWLPPVNRPAYQGNTNPAPRQFVQRPTNPTFSRPAPNQPTRPTNSVPEDPAVRELRERLAGLTIGSFEHQQLKNEARLQGRCFICFKRDHQARDCTFRPHTTHAVYECAPYDGPDEDSSYEEDCQRGREIEEWEEQEPSRDQWDPESAQ
jgi:hypothetical protein